MIWIFRPRWSVSLWLGSVLGVLVLMLGAAVPSSAADVCVEVSVSSVPAPALIFADGFETGSIVKWEDPDPVSSFPATGILDLLFDLTLVGEVVGDLMVELAVYTPSGHLYQQLSAPVSSLAVKAWSAVPVEGHRDPLPMHVAQAGTTNELQLRLPVAGTPIIANSLYGTWTARIFIGGEPANCADPLTFEMTQ